LTPLKGMGLESLELTDTRVTDLATLRGLPLTSLNLQGLHGVRDLSPLKGMPLGFLSLWQTAVSDLSPLAEMKSLRGLELYGVPVSDLSPLRVLPLSALDIRGVRATDLSPIKALPLKELWIDYRADRQELLRSLMGLESINDKPAAEFWKDVGKPTDVER